MKLWRISSYSDLEGKGGLLASGRWHNVGRPVIYAAEHQGLAVVEYLAHVTDPRLIPPGACLFSITIPPGTDMVTVEPATLPSNWKDDEAHTRDIGTTWLDEGKTPLLKVPAATIDGCWNYIINPVHADCGSFVIADKQLTPLDRRLFGKK